MNNSQPLTETLNDISEKDRLMRDCLTSLFSKNYFMENMDTFSLQMMKGIVENKKNRNHNKTWSIMFCDIDGLKLTNDTMGHVEADEGIAHIAGIVRQSIRTNRDETDNIIYSKGNNKNDNIPIRFGGDEFVILLPNCTKEQAVLISDRIKQKIELEKDKTKNMALSIGIADTNEMELPTDLADKDFPKVFINNLLSIAEKRMYNDKNKDIRNLPYEDKRRYIMKHLNRFASQIGLALDDEQIDSLTTILTEIKNNRKTTK